MTKEIVQDTASFFSFTPDEVPEFLRDEYFDPELRGKMNALQVLVVNEIRRAVAVEREACAHIADDANSWITRSISPEAARMGSIIAKHIRARGQVQE